MLTVVAEICSTARSRKLGGRGGRGGWGEAWSGERHGVGKELRGNSL